MSMSRMLTRIPVVALICYGLVADYGTGSNGAISRSAAATYYYTGNHSENNYWEYADNWDPEEEPGSVASQGDVVVFDESRSLRNETNIWNNDRYVRDVQFNTTGTWKLYHNHFTLHLHNPDSGVPSRFTQNNSGAITINCDTSLDTDTVFGGTGTGTVTINGRVVETDATHGLREGLYGPGGLTKEGSYTLTLENYASYQGATVINEGTLLFNAESAKANPAFASGDPSTWTWVPVTMGQVTVNSGATLGGTGILRAPVTVNSGGDFAPGGSPGILTIDNDLVLAAGSNTRIELGGLTPGSGSGHHDQAIVTGQLSLGGTLNISLFDGHMPTVGASYTIFRYGSLDASANAFDTIAPAIVADYGSGTNDVVTITVTELAHYYTRGHATDDWWGRAENWGFGMVPGSNASAGEIVVFALTDQASYSVNTHSGNPYIVKEMRFEGTSDWTFYNPHRDIGLNNPESGGTALFTHSGSGSVTLDCDLIMQDDTVFGGIGSGTITVNGSPFHSSLGPAVGVAGSGGLTKNGDYTLVVNTVANYAGETVINAGALLFNGESAEVNSGWVGGQADTYYNPVTMAAVTVNDGGTLGGTGILRAPVTVHSGGMLSPGASAGIFTVGSLTLDSGSTTLMELGGLTAGNGAGYHDQVLVTDLLSLGGTLELALLDGFEPEIGDSFVLFEYGSLDATHNAFDTLSIPFDGEFTISYGTGTNSQVVLRAVPEPGALVLLLLGLAALLLRRNRS